VGKTPLAFAFFSDAILATVESWSYPFQGNSPDSLYQYMTQHDNSNVYARLLPIVQSSGMGKSRMTDELSKKHFVVPFNLREGRQGAFFQASILAQF